MQKVSEWWLQSHNISDLDFSMEKDSQFSEQKQKSKKAKEETNLCTVAVIWLPPT